MVGAAGVVGAAVDGAVVVVESVVDGAVVTSLGTVVVFKSRSSVGRYP
jgi:hypothetical protein